MKPENGVVNKIAKDRANAQINIQPVEADRLRKFYDITVKDFGEKNLPDYDRFKSSMSDPAKARKFYEIARQQSYGQFLPADFSGFSAILPAPPSPPPAGSAPVANRLDRAMGMDISVDDTNHPDRMGEERVVPDLPALRNQYRDFLKANQEFRAGYEKKHPVAQGVIKDGTLMNPLGLWKKLLQDDDAEKREEEDRARYENIRKQDEEFQKAIGMHPDVLSKRGKMGTGITHALSAIDTELEARQKQVPVFSRAYTQRAGVKSMDENDREIENMKAARKLYLDAESLLKSPSRYDASNPFVNFMRGAGDTVNDRDFWTFGLTRMARNLDIRGIQEKLSRNTEGKEIEEILTPGEQKMLDAFYKLSDASAERAKDLSLGYQGGAGAAESLKFMAEFLATGGLASAASRGATSAVSRWLLKRTASGSLARQAGKGLAWGTKSTLGTLARTPAVPSTYANATDRLTQYKTDEGGNILYDQNRRPILKSPGEAIREGFVHSFIENLSEASAPHIAGALGVAGKAAGRVLPEKLTGELANMADRLADSRLGDPLKWLNRSPLGKLMKDAGYNGLAGEWAEEWYGRSLQAITGDPDALKDYATVENQIVTVSSFLPMALFGMSVGTARMQRARQKYENSKEALEAALSGLGYDREKITYLTDQVAAASNRGMAKTITPLVNTIAEANPGRGKELFTAVSDFAFAKGAYHLLGGSYKEQMAGRKMAEDKRMEEATGGYVNSATGNVDIAEDAEGNTGYIVGESMDGDHKVYIINKGGEKITVSHKDFGTEGYRLVSSFDKDAFLGEIIMNREAEQEIAGKPAQEPTAATTVSPGTGAQPAQQPAVPLTVDGKPDYNAMSPDMFAEEYEKEFGADGAKSELSEMVADLNVAMEKLLKKKPTDRNERADNRREVLRLTQEREDILQALKKYEPKAKEGEVVGESGVQNVLADRSTDAIQAPDVREVNPVGRGLFGNIYDQFRGKAKEAIDFLLQKKEGEALGALHHPQVGDIDLVWGNEKAGLMKIADKHPEVLDSLQELLDDMKMIQSSDNRIVLESETHKAIVSKKLGALVTDNWLLTAYEKKKGNISASSSDIETEPIGKQNGTAPLQNIPLSTSKDTKSAGENQETGGNNVSDAVHQEEPEVNEGAAADREVLRSVVEQYETEQGHESYEPLTEDEISNIIAEMKDRAEDAPVLELSPENWVKEFGDDGIVETPIGKVKMGENQYLKLLKYKRESQFGMIKSTLSYPDIVLEDIDPRENSERDSKYLFVKTFTSGGKKYINFESVTVSKEENEVVISNHMLTDKQVKNKLEKGKLLWNRFEFDSDASGEHQDYTTSTTLNPSDGERGAKSQNNVPVSIPKDTKSAGEKQEAGGNNVAEVAEQQEPFLESRRLSVSDKEDNIGNKFYADENGSIDLWKLPDKVFSEIGRQKAPIRLTDYNVEHIISQHEKEFANSEQSVFDFIDSVFSGFNEVRKSGRTLFVVVSNDKTGKSTLIKLFPSKYGDYYNVETAGYWREKSLKEKDLIWRDSEPHDADTESADASTRHPQQVGRGAIDATSQNKSLSTPKDTKSAGENQEAGENNVSDAVHQEEPEVNAEPAEAQKEPGDIPTIEEQPGDNRGIRYREQSAETLKEVNERFNRELQPQIEGKLPKGHVYRLGQPSGVLLSAGIPDLPIELAASRLNDKSQQDNHPFNLSEISNLPDAIHNPLAVFRSATHLGSFVVMTEIEHRGKNFVVAIEANRQKGKIDVNSIRSIHYRTSNAHIANWIEEGLLEYADKKRMSEWLFKQRYNSADVKQLFGRATNILKNFENPSVSEGEISSAIDGLSADLGVKINKVKNRKDLPDGIQRRMQGGRYPGLYDAKTGEVYVVTDEITDARDAQATVLHEVVGHKGIHGLFGDKLPEFCKRVLDSMDDSERTKLVEKHNGNEQLAAEEYVASFAEGYTDPTAWEKVKAIVKALLRDMGIDLRLSDNDLMYILWKARNGLRETDGMLDTVRKIAGDRIIQDNLFREAGQKRGRIEKLRNSNPVVITGNEIPYSDNLKEYKRNALEYGKSLRGEYVNKDTGERILLSGGNKNGGLKEVLQHDIYDIPHLQSIAAIPDIIENSIYIDSIKNEDKSKNPEVSGYDYYVCGLNIAGVDYTVRSVVAEQPNGERYYDHKLTYIEKKKLLDSLSEKNFGFNQATSEKTLASSGLSSMGESGEAKQSHPAINKRETSEISPVSNIKDKRLLSILQTETENNESESRDAEVLFRESSEDVNRKFNEELDLLTEENADRVVLNLGIPSAILLSAGISNKPMKLYGNKVIKKMKKHGFALSELENLPRAMANPIAVFDNLDRKGNRSILTELKTEKGNILVSVDLGKGMDMDFNIISSTFGKGERNIMDWINQGFATYINKEKALDYLHHPALIAETSNSQRLSSTTNIVKNFENPSVEKGNSFVNNNRGIRYREENAATPKEVNERFNRELQQQIEGKLPKGHVYRLGNPSGSLLSAGIPDLPIELAASKLETKSSSDYESNHPFELKEIENLPEAISNPIAVFDSKTKFGHKVILTELKSGENNFVVAMQINSHPKGFRSKIEINDIRSVYPKDNVKDIISWINRGDLLRYADKNKILNWVTQQRSNSAEVAIPTKDLDVATNILKNFENPSVKEGEISSVIDGLSADLGVKINKVTNRKDLPDGIQRRMQGGRYPGLYDAKTGEVYVVTDEITDARDAQATVLHEVVGHKGIHGLFDDKLPEFCKRVLDSMDEGKRAALLEKYGGNEQLAAEEYVASFAEGYTDPTAWEKVKAIVKALLRDMGIDLRLSDNDLMYILWKARNGLRETDGMLDTVRKIAGDRITQDNLFREADQKRGRIEKLRNSKPVVITGNEIPYSDNLKEYKRNALEYGKSLRGEYTTNDGRSVVLNRDSLKEVLHHDYKDVEHLQSIAAIPQLIENGIYIDTIQNEDVNKNNTVSEYDYYVVGLNIGEQSYTVKFVLSKSADGTRYYDHKLTQIEKGELLNLMSALSSTASEENNSPLSTIKDKRLLSILQTETENNESESRDAEVLFRESPEEVNPDKIIKK